MVAATQALAVSWSCAQSRASGDRARDPKRRLCGVGAAHAVRPGPGGVTAEPRNLAVNRSIWAMIASVASPG